MKFIPFSVVFACLSVCGLARAVETEIPDDIVSSTNYTINVDAGTTNVYSGTLALTDGAKLVKAGLGILALSGANSLPGGIDIQAGTLRADGATCLGDGPIEIHQGLTDQGKLFLNSEGMQVVNASITVSGTYNNATDYAAIQSLKSATVKSNVIASNGLHFGNYPVNGVKGSNTQVTTFDGYIDTGTKEVRLRTYGTLVFNGAITSGVFYTSTVASNLGALYLNNPANAMTAIQGYNCGPIAGAEGAFGHGYVYHSYGTVGKDNNHFQLNGYDQTLSYLYISIKTETVLSTDESLGCHFSSSPAATLTLTGGSKNATRYADYKMDTGVSLVCDFTQPTFTQVISNRTHTTAEPLDVKCGTLSLCGTTSWTNLKTLHVGAQGVLDVDTTVERSFPALTSLTIEDGGKVRFSETSPDPFSAGFQLALDLKGDAELTLPPNVTVNCAWLTVDGQPLEARTYTTPCDEIPQIKSVATVIAVQKVLEPHVANWTGAAETDNWMSTLGNWLVDGAVPQTLDLQYYSVAADIGSAGSEMAPDGTVNVASVKVSRAFDQPPFVIGATGETLTVDGKMTLTNCAQVILRGTIASPRHVDQGDPEKNGLWTLYVRPHEWPSSRLPSDLPEGTVRGQSDRTLPLVLDGATVEKPVYYVSGESAGSQLFYALPGTTNVLKGKVAWGTSWGYLDIGENAVLEFAGGVAADTRALMQLSTSGTLKISETPVEFGSGLTLSKGLLVLDAPECKFVETTTAVGGLYATSGNAASIEFLRSGCFTSDGCQQLSFGGSAGAKTVEFHATTQRVSRLKGMSTQSKSVLHGDEGSMLEICGGCRSLAASKVGAVVCMTNLMQVTGGLGFHYLGSGKSGIAGQVPDGWDDAFVLTGKDFESTGGLEVDAGTLELTDTATWRNGTNLVARGTGTLKIGKSETFGRRATLRFEGDGKLYIPDGARQRVAECLVDGAGVPVGTYTHATAPDVLKPHLAETTGELQVVGRGLLLIVR